ncbi:MAG TPA: energy transducer TonB [Bacteroidia bacterium]|nr:energy transducer TonB [Bacteroidia bacterium]
MKTVTRVIRIFLIAVLSITYSAVEGQQIYKSKGKVKCKYDNGRKMAKGRVLNFQKQGTWKYWNDEGRLDHLATFRNDTLNGRYVEYHADRRILTSGQFSNNLKDGVWKMYYPNGVQAGEYSYNEGKLEGKQISWYENGQMRELLVCNNDQLISRKTWYYNGSPRHVETYIAGTTKGTWITYPEPYASADTFPAAIDEYSSGQLHGWHYGFRNGRKTEETRYEMGIQEGFCCRWDDNGRMVSSENYRKGERDGLCRYYSNGNLFRDIYFKDGTQHGAQINYGRRGEVVTMSWYALGNRDSVKTFHLNGKPATRTVFGYGADNTEHRAYTEWDEAGVKLLYGRYVAGQKYGEWYTYYPSGFKKSVTTYENGVMNGPYTKWYTNGNRMIEFYMVNNAVSGQPAVWNEYGKLMRPGTRMYNEMVDGNQPGEVYNDASSYVTAKNNRREEGPAGYAPFEAVENISSSPVEESMIEERVYAVPDVMPVFPGGAVEMQNFLDKNLKHPASLVNVQGTVYISYIVEADGRVTHVEASKEVEGAPDFTAEAIRVVKMFPEQVPGTVNGKPVRCRMVVPVQFNLM